MINDPPPLKWQMKIATFNIKAICLLNNVFYCLSISLICFTDQILFKRYTLCSPWCSYTPLKNKDDVKKRNNNNNLSSYRTLQFCGSKIKKLLVKSEFHFLLFPPPTELYQFVVRKTKNNKLINNWIII